MSLSIVKVQTSNKMKGITFLTKVLLHLGFNKRDKASILLFTPHYRGLVSALYFRHQDMDA